MKVSERARDVTGSYPWQGTAGRALLGLGVMGVMTKFIIGIVQAALASRWYGTPKAVRDGAEAGSDVLAWLGTVNALEAWSLPFMVFSLSLILVGITVLLWGIVNTIQRRGSAMAVCVPYLREHLSSH